MATRFYFNAASLGNVFCARTYTGGTGAYQANSWPAGLSAGAQANTIDTATTASGTKIYMTHHFVLGLVTTGFSFSNLNFNISMIGLESNAMANCSFGVEIFKLTANGSSLTSLGSAGSATELSTSITTVTANSTLNAGASVAAGDILVAVPYVKNVGTMASGYTVTWRYGGTTNYNSYVEFTETFDTNMKIGIDTSGTAEPLVLHSDNSTVDSSWDRLRLASADGTSEQYSLLASHNAVIKSFITDQLDAATIAGWVRVKLLGIEESGGANAGFQIAIYKTNSDGTNPVQIGGNGGSPYELGSISAALMTHYCGAAGSITSGQRLRVEVRVGAAPNLTSVSTWTVTLTSDDVDNQSDITFFGVDWTEQSGGGVTVNATPITPPAVSIPTPTMRTDQILTAAPVTPPVVSLPAPTVRGHSNAPVTAITPPVVSMPSVGVTAGARYNAAPITPPVVSIPAPTVRTDAIISVSPIVGGVTIPSPGVSAAAAISAAPIAPNVVSVPSPTVRGHSNVNATGITPPAVSIPTPTVSVGGGSVDAFVSVNPIVGSVSVPVPGVTAGSRVNATPITPPVVNVVSPTVRGNANVVASSVVTSPPSMPSATIRGGATAPTSPIVLGSVSMPLPGVTAGARATPTPITMVASIPTPTMRTDAIINVSPVTPPAVVFPPVQVETPGVKVFKGLYFKRRRRPMRPQTGQEDYG